METDRDSDGQVGVERPRIAELAQASRLCNLHVPTVDEGTFAGIVGMRIWVHVGEHGYEPAPVCGDLCECLSSLTSVIFTPSETCSRVAG